MPQFYAFNHMCRHFRAMDLYNEEAPTPSTHLTSRGQRHHRGQGTDEQGFQDLDAFQAAHNPLRGLPGHSRQHSTPTKSSLEVDPSAGQVKRNSHTGVVTSKEIAQAGLDSTTRLSKLLSAVPTSTQEDAPRISGTSENCTAEGQNANKLHNKHFGPLRDGILEISEVMKDATPEKNDETMVTSIVNGAKEETTGISQDESKESICEAIEKNLHVSEKNIGKDSDKAIAIVDKTGKSTAVETHQDGNKAVSRLPPLSENPFLDCIQPSMKHPEEQCFELAKALKTLNFTMYEKGVITRTSSTSSLLSLSNKAPMIEPRLPDSRSASPGSIRSSNSSKRSNSPELSISCAGCGSFLMNTTCFACTFPSCTVRVCKECCTMLSQHTDDGGFYGEVPALRHFWAVKRGHSQPKDFVSTIKHPKKGTSIGANYMLRLAEKRAADREFEERWGRPLGGWTPKGKEDRKEIDRPRNGTVTE
ncbi:hypothetical protein EDC01DRAFT_626730 [Geopyxis carbonaria]|nr:hypothetical protein EDC01DRAFT_626730 [Geopyxis carbonaria]